MQAHVDAIDQDAAALDVIEAHHERGDGGLPGTGMAHDGRGLVGRDGERDASQDPLDAAIRRKLFVSRVRNHLLLFLREVLVGKPYVAELDGAECGIADLCRVDRLRRGDDLWRSIYQAEDTLGRGHGCLQDVVLLA